MGKRAAAKAGNESPVYDWDALHRMADAMLAETGGEAYTIVTSDVVGFWDPEICPIHCIPKRANVGDGQLDSSKPSLLIFATLLASIPLYKVDSKTSERTTVQGKVGDLVGIWAKAGMRDVRNLADVPVLMYATGTVDVGKPNEMLGFEIRCPRASEGKPIQIVEDRREKSKDNPTFLERRRNSLTAPKAGKPVSEDDFLNRTGEEKF